MLKLAFLTILGFTCVCEIDAKHHKENYEKITHEQLVKVVFYHHETLKEVLEHMAILQERINDLEARLNERP
jgi:hypothetical protein